MNTTLFDELLETGAVTEEVQPAPHIPAHS